MRKFLVLALFASIVFVGCTVNAPGNDDQSVSNYSIDSFDLTKEFTAGVWKYEVTADMPTPCHTFTVEELIAESFPEQVTLNIKVSEPGIAESCIQVIDTQTVSGELKVDEKATIRLGTVTASIRDTTL